MKVGAVELTEEEVREFREVFDLVDKDGGGTIEAKEVKELMELHHLLCVNTFFNVGPTCFSTTLELTCKAVMSKFEELQRTQTKVCNCKIDCL